MYRTIILIIYCFVLFFSINYCFRSSVSIDFLSFVISKYLCLCLLALTCIGSQYSLLRCTVMLTHVSHSSIMKCVACNVTSCMVLLVFTCLAYQYSLLRCTVMLTHVSHISIMKCVACNVTSCMVPLVLSFHRNSFFSSKSKISTNRRDKRKKIKVEKCEEKREKI